MTPRQLQILTNKWARRLHLTPPWKIKAVFGSASKAVDASEADRAKWDFKGAADIDLAKFRATIVVDKSLAENRIPALVIHELEHILLDPTNRIGDDSLFETGLDHTVDALLRGFGE
jgi:uncharacterized protein YcbX